MTIKFKLTNDQKLNLIAPKAAPAVFSVDILSKLKSSLEFRLIASPTP